MLKTLIIATVLLPTLALAQRSQQLPQPIQPGQWCPVGWISSGSYCVPGSDKAPAAIPEERLVSGRLARERQLLHPPRCEQRHCAPARLGRGGFSEAAMPHYRSAQQRRFPEPFVREIEERFGDCLDTDHSAGRGNGMSGIVAGKQPNEAERVHRGE